MANVTGSVKLQTSTTQVISGLPGTVTNPTVQQNPGFTFSTSGTTADKADLRYIASLVLSAAPTTIDLTSLLAVDGSAVNFARVREISVINQDTTDGHTVTMEGGASNPWTSMISGTSWAFMIPPSTANNQGTFAAWAPNTTAWVVGSTNKTLKFDPGSATITIAIEIIGASV